MERLDKFRVPNRKDGPAGDFEDGADAIQPESGVSSEVVIICYQETKKQLAVAVGVRLGQVTVKKKLKGSNSIYILAALSP